MLLYSNYISRLLVIILKNTNSYKLNQRSIIMAEDKKRLLYVDRTYPEGYPYGSELDHNAKTSIFASALEKRFDVTFYRDLNEKVISQVEQIKPDAMVTHVPDSPREARDLISWSPLIEILNVYGDSLDIIKKIKTTNFFMPIVAYSGAPPHAAGCFMSYGIDSFVPKSNDYDEDFRKVNSALDLLFQQYAEEKVEIEREEKETPKMERTQKSTLIHPVLKMPSGIGMVCLFQVYRLCKESGRNVRITSEKTGNYPMNDFIQFCLGRIGDIRGTKFEIEIEGTDEQSENLAKKLYSGFISRREYLFSLDRKINFNSSKANDQTE
jgi:hypothetical protein